MTRPESASLQSVAFWNRPGLATAAKNRLGGGAGPRQFNLYNDRLRDQDRRGGPLPPSRFREHLQGGAVHDKPVAALPFSGAPKSGGTKREHHAGARSGSTIKVFPYAKEDGCNRRPQPLNGAFQP